MSKPKITKDVKSNAQINDLKVKRNAGELTTEVVQMCCDQLDEMVEVAVERAGKNDKRDLNGMVNALRSCPEMLAEVCKFSDSYEEVIRWNRLIREKKIPMAMTVAHREVDLVTFHKICEKYHSTWTNDIAFVLYNYAYARLEAEKKASKKSK